MKINSVLLLILLTTFLGAKGQILYTDFVPDTILTAPTLDTSYNINLDINQDGNFDFVLSLYTYWSQGTPTCCTSGCCVCKQVAVYPLDTNSKIGWVDTLFLNGPCRHLTVDSGIVIDSTSFYWRGGGTLLYQCLPIFINCHQSTTKKFIPVKLFLNGNYYYGWIRVMDYTIYDMAINLTPNQPIIASQMLTGIVENEKNNSINIFPIPFKNELKVSKANSGLSDFILYDVIGRRIIQTEFTNILTLNTESLEKGIYIYEVRNKSESCKKGKVVKD